MHYIYFNFNAFNKMTNQKEVYQQHGAKVNYEEKERFCILFIYVVNIK